MFNRIALCGLIGAGLAVAAPGVCSFGITSISADDAGNVYSEATIT